MPSRAVSRRASANTRSRSAKIAGVVAIAKPPKSEPHAVDDPRGSERARRVRNLRLGRVLDFMRAVWAIDHGLQSNSKRMESGLGITGLQRLVIRIVGRFPGISAGELADVLLVHPSTLTGVLRRLEKRGVVAREVPPDDQRRALFRLTDIGNELNGLQAGTTEAAVRRTMAKHSSDDLSATMRVLTTLSGELSEGQSKK